MVFWSPYLLELVSGWAFIWPVFQHACHGAAFEGTGEPAQRTNNTQG